MCSKIYVQKNRDNSWGQAYDWQSEMISLPLDRLQSPEFKVHDNNVYVVCPIISTSSFDCETAVCSKFQTTFVDTGCHKLHYYVNIPWYLSLFGVKTEVKDKIPAGFICNITTGTSRMYIISDLTELQMTDRFPHSGPPKMCQGCMTHYLDLMANKASRDPLPFRRGCSAADSFPAIRMPMLVDPNLRPFDKLEIKFTVPDPTPSVGVSSLSDMPID